MWLLSAVTLFALLRVLAHLGVVDVAGISELSWWWVLAGFALSAGWFAYADHTGLTRRKTVQRMERRKKDRLQKLREMLGTRRKR